MKLAHAKNAPAVVVDAAGSAAGAAVVAADATEADSAVHAAVAAVAAVDAIAVTAEIASNSASPKTRNYNAKAAGVAFVCLWVQRHVPR